MSKKSNSERIWVKILLTVLGIIVVWGIATFFVFPMFVSDIALRGQWGDSFGMINALFSGLAFAGVIWTIYLQKQELGLQRKELENTRKEMAGQKFATQKQNFESSFFQFLKMLDEKYKSVEYQRFIEIDTMRENPETVYENYKNRDAYSKVSEPYEHEGETFIGLTAKGDNAFTAAVLDGANFRIEMYLNSYFSLLFTAFRFIDEADFTKNFEEKKFYTDILRGQMRDYEMILLCILAAHPEHWRLGDRNNSNMEGKIFKALIEKYSLLSNINAPNKWKKYITCYSRSAFGDNRPDIDEILEQNQRES